MEDTALRELVAQLRKEGKSLNEILDILHKEHEVKLTFLELRMLVAEIEKNKPVEKKPPKREPAKKEEAASPAGGGAVVEIDQIPRPGAQLSGRASLPSGARVQWFVDAMGRLGMSLEPGSAQPTQADIMAFQETLTRRLQGGL